MNRNEYRRAFIMLRAAMQGYGGHVRLERRTLTGTMYFIVTAPEGAGPLAAALAGQRNGQYYAAPLGALSRDRRGQLTLAWQFDPRSIDGRPLEAYAWVAVVDADNPCRVVLTGNVEGSREVDPAALERAVCALFGGSGATAAEAPAADIPEADEPLPRARPGVEDPAPAQPDAPTAVEAESAAPESDVKIYTRARESAAAARPPEADAVPANAEVLPAPEVVLTLYPPEATAEPPAAEVEPEAGPCAEPRTAAQVLGLDITRPWPGAAEALRRLFATQAPVDAPLEGGYVYVEQALPAGGGFERCLAGLRASDGRITGIRYALSGPYAPEPPAGLEQYAWTPADGGAGWWVLDADIL